MSMRRCLHFLDKEVVPLGDQQNVRQGNHRRFEVGQAFALILAYRLSELGVPLRRLKRIVEVVHDRFRTLKMPVSDEFCPPEGRIDAEFRWCLVLARGEYLVIVPEEYVSAWFRGQTKWYVLSENQLIELADTVTLDLCWLQIPLSPINGCLRSPFLGEFDLTIDP